MIWLYIIVFIAGIIGGFILRHIVGDGNEPFICCESLKVFTYSSYFDNSNMQCRCELKVGHTGLHQKCINKSMYSTQPYVYWKD